MPKLEEMPEMTYEAYVPLSSKGIIGKTGCEIEENFLVSFEKPAKNVKIYAGMNIKVSGNWDEVDRFRDFYDLF